MISRSEITILDPTMEIDDIRIVKSPEEIFGFNIKNESGEHLFIEIKYKSGFLAPGENNIDELIIRK